MLITSDETCSCRVPFNKKKQAALLRMKHAELAAQNRAGAYWVAAENRTVTIRAIQGRFPLDDVRRITVLTDGAARIVDLFGLLDWPAVLDVLDQAGPTELIRRVRAIEAATPPAPAGPGTKAATPPPPMRSDQPDAMSRWQPACLFSLPA